MHAIVAARQIFGFLEQRANVRLQSFALPDHADTDAVAMQGGEVVTNKPAQQSEQVADFGSWPRPVFGAEGKNRQIANTKFAGGANDMTQGFDAAAMTFYAR